MKKVMQHCGLLLKSWKYRFFWTNRKPTRLLLQILKKTLLIYYSSNQIATSLKPINKESGQFTFNNRNQEIKNKYYSQTDGKEDI